MTLALLIFGLAESAVLSSRYAEYTNHAPETAKSPKHVDQQPWDLRAASDPTAAFTFLLFVVACGQVGLFWWQLGLIRDGTEDTARAAEAAMRSATIAERALTELERPFVCAEITEAGITIETIGSTDVPRSVMALRNIELSLFNYGRTPAIVTRIEWLAAPACYGSIVGAIDSSVHGGREMPVGIVAVQDKPFRETRNFRGYFAEDAELLAEGRKSLWVVGFVRYDDLFGNHYIAGFTMVYDGNGKRFVVRGGKERNYTHKENQEDIPPPGWRA